VQNFAAPLLSMQTTLAQTGHRGGRPTHGGEGDEAPFHRLTRAEAEELRRRQPVLSPWAVVGAQAVLGLVIAGAAWLGFDAATAASALYGAAVAVIPGALMARAATSRLSRLAPALSAFSMLLWAMVKIGTSVLLLALAARVVHPLSWPALLVGLVLCLQVYWFALLWRGRTQN
jgi:ATP synthase protein I